VIPAAVADEATRVLEEVIAHGTGTAANLGRPAAGKTGTTESLADAWFDGYTPVLAAAVWVGYPQARIPMKHVHGIEVFGGTFPARIWRAFMLSALHSDRSEAFAQPTGSIHWKRWCGPFQYARTYADALKAGGRCTPQTTTRKQTTTAKTRTRKATTTHPTTTRGTTTLPPPRQTTTSQPTTTSAPPPTTTAPPPPPSTTTQTTTTAPTTTTPTTTTATTTTGG
jgi:membrane carboxypeptidase/penicillin-binding protein